MESSSDPNPSSPTSSTSPASPSSSSASTTGTQPPALPIALKVDFDLNTPDGLRHIAFGLEKDTDGTKVNWTITFVLSERNDTNTPFGDPLVSLRVFVATTLHAQAETAAQKGLTAAQTAHATGPAADAAKAVHEGTMPLPIGNKIIQNTLK